MNNWFPERISQVAKEIDDLFWYATAWTGTTGLVVLGILAAFLILYRARKGRLPFYTHGNTRGAMILTLSLAVVVFIALDLNLAYHDHLVWESMFGRPPESSKALRVQIMPEQFAWNIRYSGADDTFNTADDIVVLNDFHVPVGKPVIVQLTSRDVIHSFFLPNLRIKQDAIPGMITSIYFHTDATGQFNIACAQHCGIGHYRMKGAFVVEPEREFNNWLAQKVRESDNENPWGWNWDQGLKAGGGPVPNREAST